MGEYAQRGRQASYQPARSRVAEPARQLSPEEQRRRRERARDRATAEADRGRAALERARAAHADRDLVGFEKAERKARASLSSLEHSLRAMQSSKREEETEEDARQRAELERARDELKAGVSKLVAPEPLPIPIANENAIIASIPGGRVDNAHLAFSVAEGRVIELLRQLDAKDRGIFLARVRKNAKGDPLAQRWARMTGPRRARIIDAMRRSRPVKANERATEKDGKSVVDALFEEIVGVPEDTGSPDDVDGHDWLEVNARQLAAHVQTLLVSTTYELGHPRLRWAKSGKVGLELAQKIVGSNPIDRLAAVLPETDLLGLANQIRPLATQGSPGKDGLLDRAAKARDEAAGSHELGSAFESAAAVGRKLTGHGGPIGPRDWDPDVGIAVVRQLDAEIRESLARLSPRIVNATDLGDGEGFDSSSIIAGHPIDRPIAQALSARDVVQVLPIGLDAPLITEATVRPVSTRWLDEPATWNWVEATPADATVEEVSEALFGTTEKAYLLGGSAPFFEVPEKQATELAPHRRVAHEAREIVDGPVETGAAALAESAVGERAALAQAEQSQSDASGDADARREGEVCRIQLDVLAERLGALGIEADLSSVRVRLERRLDSLDTESEDKRQKLAALFAGQREVLLEVGAFLGRAGTGPAGLEIGRKLGRVAAAADLVQSARAMLADIRSGAGDLAFDLAHLTLDQAKARFEGLESALANTKTTILVLGEEVEFTDIRGGFNRLREKALDVELRKAAGTLEPAELEGLLDEIQAFELKVRISDQVTRLTQAMEGLSGLHGWNASIVGVDDDLADSHLQLKSLRSALVSKFRRLVERQAQLAESLQAGDKASAALDQDLVAHFEAELKTLGNDDLQRALQHAYDTIDDAQSRLALLEVAKMVGLALITSGVGAVASGVARGFQLGELAIGAIGATAEAGFSAAVMAGTSDEPFLESFGTELVTNLAFFGAFRAFEHVWAGTQAGRITAGWKQAGGVDKLAAAAIEGSAQAALSTGMAIAAAEAKEVATKGRMLTGDERAEVAAQATAMHIGMTIGHKVAGPLLKKLEAVGAKASGLIVKAHRIRSLAKTVEASGSLDETLQLVNEARDLVLEEARLHEQRAQGEPGRVGPTDEPVRTDPLVELAKETGVAFEELALDAIVAQSGLEPITGGLAGTTGEVAALVVKAEAAGLTAFQHVRPDGSRIVTLEGQSSRIQLHELERTGSPNERGESLETQIEVNRLLRNPPPLQRHIDQLTGVTKSDTHASAQADLASFYKDQDAQAQKRLRVVSGRQADGPYRWRYGADATPLDHGLVHVQYRVFLDPQGVDATEIPAFQDRVRAGVDQYYNHQHEVTAPGGREARLHVEVDFVGSAAEAHMVVTLLPGQGRARASKWYLEGSETTHAHEVGHGAFGLVDEYVDAAVPNRADETKPGFFDDSSLMGDYPLRGPSDNALYDDTGRLFVDPLTSLKPRHLEHISSLWRDSLVARLLKRFGFAGDAPRSAEKSRMGDAVEARITREEPGTFELELTESELADVVVHGRKVGLDDETIEDMIFIGSRNEKRLSAADIKAQMDNHREVLERGFPYRFKSGEDFNEFVSAVQNTVAGIVPGRIVLQGSALRSPEAKDVDLAILVGPEFNQLLVESFDGKVRRDGEVVPLDIASLGQLADEISSDHQGGEPYSFNATARTLMHAFQTRKIRDKDIRGLRKSRRKLESRWGKIDLSVVESATGFDLKPLADLTESNPLQGDKND